MFENIVISGIAGRYPGSDSIDQLKDHLFENKDLITENDSRWPPGLYGLPKRHGKVSNINKFDAQFFGIHGKQVNAMDPQLRILLEKTFEAIMDSGTSIKSIMGSRTGVFIGSSVSDTSNANLSRAPDVSGFALPGCDTSMFANRISFSLDLKGPSYTVNTACSSSAVALYEAVVNIRSGHCDAAIVGGVHLILNPGHSVTFNKMQMLSTDGKCKFLDESADGYVRSEACSVIFLQKSSQAKRIYATIVGVLSNTDGYKEQGITYPSSEVQSLLMKSTLKAANVDPNSITYIEAHGTGTQVGDQCEMEAIARAYCSDRDRERPLLVGSVKTNLGHSEPASALTSIAKVLIAFENNSIPASIHFNKPNPNISALTSGLIKPVTENTLFDDNSIVGINSFGFGGANVHILLKPNTKLSSEEDFSIVDNIPRIIPLFGRTEESVKYLIESIENNINNINRGILKLLNNNKDTSGMNFRGFTLAVKDYDENKIIFENKKSIEKFQGKPPLWFIFPENSFQNICEGVVKAFPSDLNLRQPRRSADQLSRIVLDNHRIDHFVKGMGSQWPGIANGLQHLPIFMDSIHKSSEILKEFGLDLIEILNDDNNSINDLINSFIAITATQIALIDLFRELDIIPDGFIGHSFGEVACGYSDGCLSREETLIASYWRARVVKDGDLPKGLMAAVCLPWQKCKQLCPEGVYPACHNSEDLVTISGEFEITNKFVEQLRADNIFAKEINSCGIAFHSPLIESILNAMTKSIRKIIRKPDKRSPKWISSSVPESDWDSDLAKYCSAEYYTNNMLSPVLFHEALQHVPKNAVVIELAPHSLLQSIIKKSLGNDIKYIPLMKKNNNSGNLQMILSSIGRLYQLGFNPDIDKLYPRVTYPVSRGTPSLSPLIKWDHSDDWFVPLYPDYFNPSNSSEYKVIIDLDRSKDAFYSDHCIQNQIIFPGTGYIVMVWQMLAESVGKSINECPIDMNDIKIHLATILNREEKTTFKIQFVNENVFIKNNNYIVFSGKAKILNEELSNEFKYDEMPNNMIILNKKEVYKEFRIRGYDYGKEFQLIEEVSADGCMSKVVFNGNWITFLDSVMQIHLLSRKYRSLYMPVSIQSFRCNPMNFTGFSEQSLEEPIFKVFQDNNLNVISICGGMIIRQPELKLATIKARTCIIEKYQFVPYNGSISSKNIDDLVNLSTRLTINIIDDILIDKDDVNFKIDNENSKHVRSSDKKFSLINLMQDNHRSKINLVKNLRNSFSNNDIDLMITERIYYNEIILRPFIDIAIENIFSNSFNVLELSSYRTNSVIDAIKSVIDRSNPILDTEYKLIITNDTQRYEQIDSDIETVDCNQTINNRQFQGWTNLAIYRQPINPNENMNIDYFMEFIQSTCKDNGFAIIIVRTATTPIEKFVLSLLQIECKHEMKININNIVASYGFVVIGKRTYSNLLTVFLIRKVVSESVEKRSIVNITCDFSNEWINTLKNKLEECNAKPEKQNIWLLANDSQYNGVIGLVNCLRKEPNGHRIRCLFFADGKEITYDEIFYKNIFEKDLLMNIVINNELGSYRHLTFNEEIYNNMKDCSHAFINVETKGDLSSLKWFECDHKYWPIGRKSRQNLINIYYSALNFRDIMISTGKLSVNALPGDLPHQKCTLGLEFAGRDHNGRRVVGMVAAKALATSVVVNVSDFLWPIPDHWSMEEACTVPVAYCTAYYALVIRGRMRKGETVLIHSGSGAVGQAAITLALKSGCRVFTTVGSQEKKEYLAITFPKLSANSFCNSRDTSFEDHVLRETKGRGVDLVLNSLAEDKLQASVRCLANHGRFLEIGKYDMSKDNPLGLSAFLKNIEFHGIVLDALFEDLPRIKSDKVILYNLIADGITSGTVVPIRRTLFDINSVEKAFRYMSSGKHIGKVVIQIRNEENDRTCSQLMTVKAISSTIFMPNKSYIIIGGLGGFGLELIQWMFEKGAKKFIVSSRNGSINNFQKLFINRIIGSNGLIEINNFDIISKCDAERLLDLAASVGEVGGIFNVAMVLNDGLFDRQNVQSFEMVCKPKVNITKNMDEISRQKCQNLDYFVVFSSLSSGKGNAGQTNYGFANSVMERICESRRRDGLHGLAIQWGAIGDVGVVAERMGGNDIEISGLVPQRINSCLEVLDRFLQSEETIISSHVMAVQNKRANFEKNIDLITKVFNILGIKHHSNLNPNTTLSEMGMDSLTGTDIHQIFVKDGYQLSFQELRNLTMKRLIEMNQTKKL